MLAVVHDAESGHLVSMSSDIAGESNKSLRNIIHKKWVCRLLHIEAETKWTQFRRRQFQMHFLEWKCMNFT